MLGHLSTAVFPIFAIGALGFLLGKMHTFNVAAAFAINKFDLPQKNKMLKDFLNKVDLQESIKNKLSEWLSDDLKKWDISRDAPYFGFKIPGEKDKYFYVWVDAPIGYLASISNWAKKNDLNMEAVSYTHLTLPTNREV